MAKFKSRRLRRTAKKQAKREKEEAKWDNFSKTGQKHGRQGKNGDKWNNNSEERSVSKGGKGERKTFHKYGKKTVSTDSEEEEVEVVAERPVPVSDENQDEISPSPTLPVPCS